jgi:hypothetical protein
MVLVFTDRFRPFSSLVTGYDPLNPGLVWFLAWLQSWRAKQGEFSRVWIFQLIWILKLLSYIYDIDIQLYPFRYSWHYPNLNMIRMANKCKQYSIRLHHYFGSLVVHESTGSTQQPGHMKRSNHGAYFAMLGVAKRHSCCVTHMGSTGSMRLTELPSNPRTYVVAARRHREASREESHFPVLRFAAW